MQRIETRWRRRHGVRGVAFVYFTALALPIMFFSAAFAVDFTRIIIAHRNMTNAAAAAAAAGSWQFNGDTLSLDEFKATAAAQQTFCRATEAVSGVSAAAGSTSITCPDGRTVPISVSYEDLATEINNYPVNGHMTINVTSDYRVDNMLFFFYFGGGDSVNTTVTARASACLPGDEDNYTGGFCSRPN